MIGGFFIGGSDPTKVLIRAIGPSLRTLGVSGALRDPVPELRESEGSLIFANNNWHTDQAQQILTSTIPPSDGREASLVVPT